MGHFDHLGEKRAARRAQLARAIGVTAMLLVIAALAWARFTQLSDGDDPALKRGAAALKRALKGEPAAYAEARAEFGRAARGVVLDAYPVFVLELTEQFERGTVKVTEPALRPVMDLLQQGKIDEARGLFDALPDRDKYAWLTRLFKDMGAE